MEEIRGILEVAQDRPPCAHVRRLLQEKLRKVEEQIARLEALKAALSERLAYAEANPDPACDGQDHCVYLNPNPA